MKRVCKIFKFIGLCVVVGSCGGLNESEDYLLWRPCEAYDYETCEEGQVCLPHSWKSGVPGDFLCRDIQSIRPGADGERPPAFCDDELYLCPMPAQCEEERPHGPTAQYRYKICVVPDVTQSKSPLQ